LHVVSSVVYKYDNIIILKDGMALAIPAPMGLTETFLATQSLSLLKQMVFHIAMNSWTIDDYIRWLSCRMVMDWAGRSTVMCHTSISASGWNS